MIYINELIVSKPLDTDAVKVIASMESSICSMK